MVVAGLRVRVGHCVIWDTVGRMGLRKQERRRGRETARAASITARSGSVIGQARALAISREVRLQVVRHEERKWHGAGEVDSLRFFGGFLVAGGLGDLEVVVGHFVGWMDR